MKETDPPQTYSCDPPRSLRFRFKHHLMSPQLRLWVKPKAVQRGGAGFYLCVFVFAKDRVGANEVSALQGFEFFISLFNSVAPEFCWGFICHDLMQHSWKKRQEKMVACTNTHKRRCVSVKVSHDSPSVKSICVIKTKLSDSRRLNSCTHLPVKTAPRQIISRNFI